MLFRSMIVNEDIDSNEIVMRIPSNIIITARVAYYSELNLIFKVHSELFTEQLNKNDWEDYLIISFILYEKSKGDKSFWHPYLNILPKDCDCLAIWKEENLKELQDNILICDAQDQRQEIYKSWKIWHDCLIKYPEYFNEDIISFDEYKWCYVVLYTRLFGILLE